MGFKKRYGLGFGVVGLTLLIVFVSLFAGGSRGRIQSKHGSGVAAEGPVPGPDVSPLPGPDVAPASGVQLFFRDNYVVLDNGIVEVTISNPNGSVTGIKYNGVDNLLETLNEEFNRGYWDVVWSPAGTKGTKGELDRLEGTKFEVVVQTKDQIEVSFTRTWNFSQLGTVVPLNIDKRYVLLGGSSGFYSYAIYEHLPKWPAFIIDNTRVVYKLRKDKFQYMVIADDRQRHMPLPDDREPPRGQALAYPEAVRLIDPVEPEFKGEVDDKYQYGCDSKDISVHGWISSDPAIGFWQITPSAEYRSGGPTKQFLTSHVGPTSLNIFVSAHYAGEDLIMKFGENEAWKKVHGPFFVYLNSHPDGEKEKPLTSLWDDAKEQFAAEAKKWPYSFPASEDFTPADQRGRVSGRLLVLDRYSSEERLPGNGAYVGLAPLGDRGSWQRETKGYQFWTEADKQGYFSITAVRPGNYNLYAFVPGFVGDYKYEINITVLPASDNNLPDLIYEPPRNGPTLWEIGVPDRSAAEFYVPDPNPMYINKLYINHTDRFRQYGLWERYAELYVDKDLVYNVSSSDYRKDWFFAQVTRKKGNNTYEGTTWQIKFELQTVDPKGTYTLQLALAAIHSSELEVRFNNPETKPPLFTTGIIGMENAIARHGIHGLYWFYSIEVSGTELVVGENTLYLTRTNSIRPFQGVMYDYIRFEGPSVLRPNN